eukprot:gene6258-7794_t
MKRSINNILSAFAFLLFTSSVTNGFEIINKHVPCGSGTCGNGQVCYTRSGISHCATLSQTNFLAIVETLEKSWNENGVEYSLYRVHITNYGDRTIRNVVISSDQSLKLKNPGSIWNIAYNEKYELFTLPNFVQSIPAKSAHLFGFIVKGNTAPNLVLRSIEFEN